MDQNDRHWRIGHDGGLAPHGASHEEMRRFWNGAMQRQSEQKSVGSWEAPQVLSAKPAVPTVPHRLGASSDYLHGDLLLAMLIFFIPPMLFVLAAVGLPSLLVANATWRALAGSHDLAAISGSAAAFVATFAAVGWTLSWTTKRLPRFLWGIVGAVALGAPALHLVHAWSIDPVWGWFFTLLTAVWGAASFYMAADL